MCSVETVSRINFVGVNSSRWLDQVRIQKDRAHVRREIDHVSILRGLSLTVVLALLEQQEIGTNARVDKRKKSKAFCPELLSWVWAKATVIL